MSGRILSSYMKIFIKLALKDGTQVCVCTYFSHLHGRRKQRTAVSSQFSCGRDVNIGISDNDGE